MRGVIYLHPELQEIVEKFLADCLRAGLKVSITDTFRTKEEQVALYAKGRTTSGSIVTNCQYPNSPHNWGVAFDFCRNDGTGAYNDSGGFFAKVGAIGKKHGLFWGGDFRSFVDKPHLELIKYLPNNSVKTLIAKYGTPENFKKTWAEQEDEDMQTQEIKIEVPGGAVLTVDGYIVDGKSYAPLREVLEKLGFKVGWINGKITIAK